MKIDLPKFNLFKNLAIPRKMMTWVVGMSLFVALIEVAWLKGAIQSIYLNDITKISVLIALIFLWQSVVCIKEVVCQLHEIKSNSCSDAQIERGWLWSDIVLSLGMIGTVIGFMFMLAGFVDVDFSDFDSVQGLIMKLSAGMSTSLSTTLVGLISSVILKIQFFGLENIVKNRKEETRVL